MSFAIEVYQKPDGDVPFDEFLSSLPAKLQAKVIRDLELLEQYGNSLREPYSKYLEDGIYELRTKVSTDITRSLYFFFDGKKIIITHGFIKKQQKTPQSEIDKAKKYRSDWIRRNEE